MTEAGRPPAPCPALLVDGNNLGHALGLFDKAAGRYPQHELVALLDSVARHLTARGQETDILLFFDDPFAFERVGAWWVTLVPVPGGDADAAIRAHARAHADRTQILVSGDQALQGDVSVWGVVPLGPDAFIERYLDPALQAGYLAPSHYVETGQAPPPAAPPQRAEEPTDHGLRSRRAQSKALERALATLRGEPLPQPDTYRLDLGRWPDEVELALYLAERHLCPAHPDLTTPAEMIAAIRTHCSRQPGYFTSGPVVNRLFRLFLCRPEHSLSLDRLSQLASTRRKKVKASLRDKGDRLGMVPAW